jgi:hypothetical protein
LEIWSKIDWAIQVILGRLKEITHKAQITIKIIKIDKPEIMVNVTLAPVSIKNAKHLFCSLAFTKSPSLLAQVSLIFIACGLLENVWLWLVTATGETSPFIGQINVQISLGKKFYKHNVCIAAISNEGILGMDFLAANK